MNGQTVFQLKGLKIGELRKRHDHIEYENEHFVKLCGKSCAVNQSLYPNNMLQF